jgi:O-antigen/teichoic acid export membrane protein
MSVLVSRSIVLVASRLANQAVLLLSPLLLVRILDIVEFGRYREFMLYATLLVVILSTSANASLIYFVPREQSRTSIYVSQSIVIVFATSCVASVLVILFGEALLATLSVDALQALAVYILVVANLDFVESYWLANRRSDLVLYYSTGRLILRLLVAVLAGLVSKSAMGIIQGLLFIEGFRCAAVLVWLMSKRLLSFHFTVGTLTAQLTYVWPLGVSVVILELSNNVSRLFVANTLGAAALALYVTGSYALPLVRVVRSSIADVIFPEIVESWSRGKDFSFSLWRRATVIYCSLLFPAAVLCIVYSEFIMVTLFTEEYAGAAPIFIIYSLTMVLFCFDFHLPLRVMNKNIHFLVANGFGLGANILLLFAFIGVFGFLGPAVAFLLSQVLVTGYLWWRLDALTEVSARQILPWSQIGRISLASGIGAMILSAFKVLVPDNWSGVTLGIIVFLAVYFVLIRIMRVKELDMLWQRLIAKSKIIFGRWLGDGDVL